MFPETTKHRRIYLLPLSVDESEIQSRVSKYVVKHVDLSSIEIHKAA